MPNVALAVVAYVRGVCTRSSQAHAHTCTRTRARTPTHAARMRTCTRVMGERAPWPGVQENLSSRFQPSSHRIRSAGTMRRYNVPQTAYSHPRARTEPAKRSALRWRKPRRSSGRLGLATAEYPAWAAWPSAADHSRPPPQRTATRPATLTTASCVYHAPHVHVHVQHRCRGICTHTLTCPHPHPHAPTQPRPKARVSPRLSTLGPCAVFGRWF